MCLKNCPDDYEGSLGFCTRQAVSRMSKSHGPMKLEKCDSDEKDTGTDCWTRPYELEYKLGDRSCDNGFTNTGLSCYRAFPAASRKLRVNCPSGFHQISDGGLCAKSCSPGYYFTDNLAGGKRTCWPNGGVKRTKTLEQRAYCPDGEQKYGGLCYDSCDRGFNMVTNGLCTRQVDSQIRDAYDRGVGTPSGIYNKKRTVEFSNRGN
jgi:hypothetical protein